MTKTCAVIIVTHNSQQVIFEALKCLAQQSRQPDEIVVIDSGSPNTEYLDRLEDVIAVTLLKEENVGFCVANNLGIVDRSHHDYILLLNPDAFLNEKWIEDAIDFMEQPGASGYGLFSSPLLGFNIETMKPSGLYDSAGIAQTAVGRWVDVGQGEEIGKDSIPTAPWEPQAVCGALQLYRGEVIEQLLQQDGYVLDPDLTMYKDDIDVCLRIKRLGWKLVMNPGLISYHCRGWNPRRSSVPYWARLLSARNELKVGWKNRSRYLPVYILKYLYVRLVEPRT